MEIHDLTGDCCPQQPKGLRTQAFLVEACAVIDPFPDPPAYDAANPGAEKVITGDIVLETGGKWKEYPIKIDSGLLESEAEGEVGSRGFMNRLTFSIPGSTKERLSFADRALNGCWLIIVKQKDGTKRLLGRPDDPAFIESLTLTNGSESNEGSYVMYDKVGVTAPIYEGAIPLDPVV